MQMMGSYQSAGYTIEAYFPESDSDTFSIWVIRDGQVVAEFTERIAVKSGYGIDASGMAQLEAAAEAAVMEVVCREALSQRGAIHRSTDGIGARSRMQRNA